MNPHAAADSPSSRAPLPGDAPPAVWTEPDPGLDLNLLSGPAEGRRLSRWMGWRLRLLMFAALTGCVALLLLANWLAEPPRIDATWRATADGRAELSSTTEPALKTQLGQVLVAIETAQDGRVAVDALTLHQSSRWLTDDAERARHVAMHEQVSQALAHGDVRLTFANGDEVPLKLAPRGINNLGLLFWLLGALALVLYMVAMVIALARPSHVSLLYSVMALCQAGNLVFIAVESTLDLSLPPPFPAWDTPVRMALDLITAAATVHATCLHPLRVRGANAIALATWASTLLLVLASASGLMTPLWWWTQSSVAALSLTGLGLRAWSYRQTPHPFGIVLQRFGVMALGTWVLLTIALAAVDRAPGVQQQIAAVGPMIWYVFFASLLLLIPFLSKSQQVMREFSLLAAISTVATSLDLLFVAVFSLGHFTSLTLALFLSLAVYTGARQWLLDQLMGSSMLTTERMFERLYRVAREVEAKPDRLPELLRQLLQTLFEPMETVVVSQAGQDPRVTEGGATLLVPLPDLSGNEEPAAQGIAMRFAHRGRRLFTEEDARLTGRILEQLRRAVAYDHAVEQGRSEERLRLAQDLHDDIGARLLTMMYKSPSPEMEEYLRHTLQDLKTLTRGLAASQHRLSHAAAEWKTDLAQRLAAAQISFSWHMSFDEDVLLNVVQWSALTRVMRELVSNTIAHSGAQRVEIHFQLSTESVELTVTDDGNGRNPQAWSHGLGLGGVRKRVKQLGGAVTWSEVEPRGIQCRVFVPQLSERT